MNRQEHAQISFLDRVNKLTSVLEDLGNPFAEESHDLFSLDTKDIANPSVAVFIHTHFERASFQEFMKGLEEKEPRLYEPIKKNCTNFFHHGSPSVNCSKEKVLKEDCQLSSKLFISCQSRECDLKEFFKHENQLGHAHMSQACSQKWQQKHHDQSQRYRRPCYSSQCFASSSSSRSTTVMDCFWSRSDHEVDSCT